MGRSKVSNQMQEFQHTYYAQEVVFRAGSLARLGERVEHSGWQRVMLCTSPSMRANGHAAAVEAALGERLAAVFDQVRPHVQDVQVDAALDLAAANNADAVIGLGGGSSIGMAKAVACALAEKRAGSAEPPAAVIAVPTTYAGSEMTAVYGITHSRETPPRKVTVSDPLVAPRLVIYDPRLTLNLPPEVTASTGINALAHCTEALYSPMRHPLSTAAAVSSIGHIHNSLYCCYRQGDDLEARTEMLLAAYLAGYSLAGVSMGLHHGLCHVLGGTANVPHGIANSIILPHAVRFNAQAAAQELLPAAEAMGISVDQHGPAAAVARLAHMISDLTNQMNLPQRLRDAGVKETDLPRLAQLAFQNRTVHNNPRPVTGIDQIEQLLRDAF